MAKVSRLFIQIRSAKVSHSVYAALESLETFGLPPVHLSHGLAWRDTVGGLYSLRFRPRRCSLITRSGGESQECRVPGYPDYVLRGSNAVQQDSPDVAPVDFDQRV
jgi:hypothetical protein